MKNGTIRLFWFFSQILDLYTREISQRGRGCFPKTHFKRLISRWCLSFCCQGEKDTGFEVSPDEVEPPAGERDDQTDAIPMSSSSDSLSMSDEPDARTTLPTPSDILVSYSTFPGTLHSWTPCWLGYQLKFHFQCDLFAFFTQLADTGYVSWRDTQSGSWYVETLDSILNENAATDDLVTMLMMVGIPHQKSSYFINWYAYTEAAYSLSSRLTMRFPRTLPKDSTSKCRVPLTSWENFSTFKLFDRSISTSSSYGDMCCVLIV